VYWCWTGTRNRKTTRKHRQSHRHADPHKRQHHMAVAKHITSNRSTVTVFVTMWPWPLTSGSMHAEQLLEYTCTKFGVDRSSRFASECRQTERQTWLNAIHMPAVMQVWQKKYYLLFSLPGKQSHADGSLMFCRRFIRRLMGRITETHVAVATVSMVMENVGRKTNIPVTLMHGCKKVKLI